MKDRKEAIELIYLKNKGKKTELVGEIGSKLYQQFCSMGLISQGISPIDGDSIETWKITEAGKKNYNFFREPSDREKKMSDFCVSIGF
jgi:hypothetical protein